MEKVPETLEGREPRPRLRSSRTQKAKTASHPPPCAGVARDRGTRSVMLQGPISISKLQGPTHITPLCYYKILYYKIISM